MSLTTQSWNPDTDGRPNEKYRTYENRKVSIFSSRDGTQWFFAINDKENEEPFNTEVEAMEAAQVKLDKEASNVVINKNQDG